MTLQDRVTAARKDLLQVEAELTAALRENRSRARAPAVRLLHEVRGMLNAHFPYASQAGQDQVVDRLLKGKTGGTFVDMGGYDGITGSNTLYFEKWRGWTGVLVEPVAAQRRIAEGLRSCPCLPYAVSDANGTAEFIAVTEGYTQMSGLAQTYDAGLLQTVRADPRHAEEVLTVETRTIAAILDETGLTAPDFISLDIEGGELAALEAFPFEDYSVRVWAIENNAGTSDIAALMRTKGYEIAEFCGPDEIFIRPDP